jgi:CRP/FNR family transcriptional regulator, cyclic AMP receptor protein
MNDVELLRSVPLFEGLDQGDLDELAGRLVHRHFKAGQIVFNQGDVGNEMYVVAQGNLNIHLPGEESRRISLKDIARGEYFGELAIFDQNPRSASVLATTDATLLELGRETLAAYLDRRPRAAISMLKTVAQRLREANALLYERAAKNAVREVEENLSWSDKLADKVADLNGSWKFIATLLLLTVGWTAVNSVGLLRKPFDEYPFVFFNLVLAILVAVQGPLIVMSQNRQALKDRAQAETDFKVNLKNEVNIETIVRELGEFRGEMNQRIEGLEGRRPGVATLDPGHRRP